METGKDATNVALVIAERALLAEQVQVQVQVQVSFLGYVLPDKIFGYIYPAPLFRITISDK